MPFGLGGRSKGTACPIAVFEISLIRGHVCPVLLQGGRREGEVRAQDVSLKGPQPIPESHSPQLWPGEAIYLVENYTWGQKAQLTTSSDRLTAWCI